MPTKNSAHALSLPALTARAVTASALASPGSISISNEGTPGAVTVTYKLVARMEDGTTTQAGAASTTTTSADTLDGTNFNRLTWSAVPGAYGYDVYRTVSPTSPATTGKINAAVLTVRTLDDTGLAGDSAAAPTTNGTGKITAAGFVGNLTGNADTATAAADGLTSATGTAPLTLTLATKGLTGSVADLIGDAGAGGTKGITPAPGSGDAAAGKFLKADATWAVPPGTGVPTSRTISTTAPLSGGGDLTGNRTLDISNFGGDAGAGGTKGTVPAPAAGDTAANKYLFADGSWKAVSAGYTPGVATVMTSAGAWTAYATLALAKAAASSGDTILVGPGTYNEANLLKNGVNWWFAPGAKVTYSGAGTVALFDDGSAGANGAVTCTIGGHGEFTWSGSNTTPTANEIFNFANASNLTVQCQSIAVTTVGDCIGGNAAWVMNLTCDTITSPSYQTIYINNAGTRLTGKVRVISNTGTGQAIQMMDGITNLVVDTFTGNGSAATIYAENPAVFTIVARSITGNNAAGVVQSITAGSSLVVDTLTASGNAYAAVVSGYLRARLVTNVGTSKQTLVAYGTGTIENSRIVNTGANGVAVLLGNDGATFLGDNRLVSDSGATDSIYAGGATTAKVFGTVYMNKAKDPNVTFVTGSYVESDSNVT